jgi:hypothetical protein
VIFKPVAAKLRAQDWTAISIEIAIVCIGVFVGNEVSNWNQARLEKDQSERLLRQLVPELKSEIAFFESAKTYYATTTNYANEALPGWSSPGRASDSQFIIAAYEASQNYGLSMNAQSWSLAFGSDQLRNIDDSKLRRDLVYVLTADYAPVAATALDTPYRGDVRKLIPNEMQVRIRSECGDRQIYNERIEGQYVLPATCRLTFDPIEARQVAARLRAHRELADELNLHLARIATYLEDTNNLERPMRDLESDLEAGGGQY